MPYICSQCGSVMEDKDEFCYRCGATRTHAYYLNVGEDVVCSNCGTKLPTDSIFCSNCGQLIKQASPVKQNKYSATLTMTAMMLAFIPGIFDVFGLGHFVLGKWVRGSIFLSCSVAIYYVDTYYVLDKTMEYVLIFVCMALFVIQALDLYRFVYSK
ncbi:MAG: zinc ribbon domain-containing protein [Candidatus Methanomethylophilaceae archaeon]